MRQLITRIDEALHTRLKRHAAASGTSVNAIVTSAIEGVLTTPEDRGEAVRRRLRSLGLLADITPPPVPPDRASVIESLRGRGTIADLIEADRDGR